MPKISKAAQAAKTTKPIKGKPGEITVIVEPLGGGGHSISYEPKVFCKKKGSGKVTLVLSDPQRAGYRFTGFNFMVWAMPTDYLQKADISPSKIVLDLDNKFAVQTDYPYEVFVALAEGGGVGAATTRALSMALAGSAIANQLEAIARTSDTVTRQIRDIALQLRSGPIIRNDPGG